MTITLRRMATGTIPAVATAVYAASGVSAQIDNVTLTNNSGSTVATVSLWIATGGGASDQNIILKDFSVPAGVTKRAWEVCSHVIPDSGTLYAKASADGVVTLVMSGREQATA